MYGTFGGFYMIVRGGTNVPLDFGGVTIPPTAKLNLFVTNGTYQPLEWIALANVSSGMQGVHFMHTLSVLSGNLNFLEACYHMYTGSQVHAQLCCHCVACCHVLYAGVQEFPGTLLSTGTEDYFDSAWFVRACMRLCGLACASPLCCSRGYLFNSVDSRPCIAYESAHGCVAVLRRYFNAGEFHLPVSGFTHLNASANSVAWSAYRFHEMDPLQFNDGYVASLIVWAPP